MAERLSKIKEEPIIDERIPHPYREVIKELRGIKAQLEEISQKLAVTIPAPPVPPVVVPGVPPAPGVVPARVPPERPSIIELSAASIKSLAKAIASYLPQLPNYLDRVEIDTSRTDWFHLRDLGKIRPATALGLWVESIGGGFEYKIMRVGRGPSKPRTALVDDKWDQEFDDIIMRGLGAGTAVLWIWWREEAS